MTVHHTRREVLAASGLSAVALTAGCNALPGDDTGTLATRVSDQPGDIEDFESCVVTISEIRVLPADEQETGEAEVVVIDAGGATVDLVALQGQKSELVAEKQLETGTYQWLKLQVTNVDATLKSGASATVTTPGNAPLKFDTEFEIRADTTTSFTADFTPVQTGRTGKYILQPVAKNVTVSYGDGGS